MLKPQDLAEHFPDAVQLAADLYRLKDEVPAFTDYYYVQLAAGGRDLLVVSENRYDDDFASHILQSAASRPVADGLDIRELPRHGEYKFDALLTAPSDYHSYFKGRLDAQRGNLFFCCPIYRCEFSGHESSREFYLLRREIVPTLNWKREPAPKILLRFDNPKTGGGTIPRKRIPAKYPILLREIDELSGVPEGFIEIENYRGRVAQIRSDRQNLYTLAVDGRDQGALDNKELKKKAGEFLTT